MKKKRYKLTHPRYHKQQHDSYTFTKYCKIKSLHHYNSVSYKHPVSKMSESLKEVDMFQLEGKIQRNLNMYWNSRKVTLCQANTNTLRYQICKQLWWCKQFYKHNHGSCSLTLFMYSMYINGTRITGKTSFQALSFGNISCLQDSWFHLLTSKWSNPLPATKETCVIFDVENLT